MKLISKLLLITLVIEPPDILPTSHSIFNDILEFFDEFWPWETRKYFRRVIDHGYKPWLWPAPQSGVLSYGKPRWG
ncbi:MAG: hypothetical protein CMN21_07465 [Rubinisphaera sp.]|nr:hypothetical protein [Rubinisphaera sp.]|tara:strand:+ start:5906 stop:6133 length:228 start_codon:yes stop_codon:yes gene_type:complete